MPLVAVVGDQESHGAGALQVPPQTKWTIGGKLVCTVDTLAAIDNLDHPPGQTNASTGSGSFYVAGKALHRQDDSRYCGATTITTGQTKFYVGS